MTKHLPLTRKKANLPLSTPIIRMFLIYIYLFSTTTFAQNINRSEKIKQELDHAKMLSIKDSEQAISLYSNLFYESKKIDFEEGMLESKHALSLLYFNSGAYEKVVEISNDVEELAIKTGDYDKLAGIYREVAASYSMLRLNEQAIKYLDKAKLYASKIKDKNRRYYTTALIYDSYSVCDGQANENVDKMIYYVEKSLEELAKISDNTSKEMVEAKYDLIGFQYFRLADISFSELKQNDKAKGYYDKSLEIYENPKYEILPNNKVILYSSLTDFYYSQKDFEQSIIYGKKALELTKKFDHPEIRKEVYDMLFKTYLETGEKEKSKYYAKLYTQLNDSLTKKERQAVNTSVNKIIDDNKKNSSKRINQIIVISVSFIIVGGLFTYIFWRRREKQLKQIYHNLIQSLQHQRYENKELDNDIPTKQDVIITLSQETENKILKKMISFEKSERFLKKDLSVSYLSNQLDTNPKYLSQIIQKHKGQNFNGYINQLRINYITNKLYSESNYRKYKISYLAEITGYTSSKVFVNAFKKINNVTPSYFIEQLKQDEKS